MNGQGLLHNVTEHMSLKLILLNRAVNAATPHVPPASRPERPASFSQGEKG